MRVRLAMARLALVSALGATTACGGRPPVPPPMPSPGTDVKVTFVQPHGINVRPDSVLVVSELSGRLLSVHGDTIALRLTRVPGQGNTKAWAGHEVRFTRDDDVKIVQTSFDGTATSAIALAGISWILIVLFRDAHY
ncbi:MAG: hypothetical protein ACJ79K_04665 [Gemmatimonadaceae bacterium]